MGYPDQSCTPESTGEAMFSAEELRTIQAAFPVLERVAYLNTGTYGPMPAPALDEFVRAVTALERGGVACEISLAEEADSLRSALADMVGAHPDEIGFTGNATDGINLAVAGHDWQPGDEVITADQEHEAMLHPLLYLQATRGIRVRRAQCSANADEMLAHLDTQWTERTRMLAFSHVTCETGVVLPAEAMCRWAVGRGVHTLLDVSQSLGAFPVHVGTIGCDCMAANGHKWLHGPTGTGFFYARRDVLPELRPAHVGAGSLARADYDMGVAEPWPTARRFEFGTRAWANAAGWNASLRWMQSLGLGRIREHMLAMGTYAMDALESINGLSLLTPRAACERAGIVSFSIAGLDAGEIGTKLSRDDAIVTRHVPHYNAVRISLAHFTSALHVDRLAIALDRQVHAEAR